MSESEFSFESEENESESSCEVEENKSPKTKYGKKKDYEEKILILMSKARKAREFSKKNLSKKTVGFTCDSRARYVCLAILKIKQIDWFSNQWASILLQFNF